MTLRCVTFDLDDTLWDSEPALRHAEAVVYQWLARDYPRVVARYSQSDLTTHRQDYISRYPHQQHDITLLRKRWLASILVEAGYDQEGVEVGFRLFWLARNEVALFDNVLQVLEALQGGYCMGVITNGNADVHHIGIGGYFDFVVTAAEAGAAKPDARIFQLALTKGRVRPQEAVHVGDDAQRDVMGAGAVGMRTVWINPRRHPWQAGTAPDAIIDSLGQLNAVLEHWAAK